MNCVIRTKRDQNSIECSLSPEEVREERKEEKKKGRGREGKGREREGKPDNTERQTYRNHRAQERIRGIHVCIPRTRDSNIT